MDYGDFLDGDGNAPDMAEALAERIDFKPMLLRRFAWDTMACDEVDALLGKLGLVVGSDEGREIDHRQSHQRMAQVLPLESMLGAYAEVMGTVLTTALIEGAGVSGQMAEQDVLRFAGQNSQIVLAGARAIVAQLMFQGILQFGPVAPALLAGT